MKMGRKTSIHIGTSGWHYGHWRGPFYPRDMRPENFLAHYQNFFHTVEINSSFYRLPLEKTLLHWRETMGKDFIFSAKASRFITHMKRLLDPEKTLPPFFDRMKKLGKKLGPILFQLPPSLRLNLDRFTIFLKKLPPEYRYSFEFRNPEWFTDRVYQVLAEYGAAFCIYHLNGRLSPVIITADFVYLRLHGPDGPYQGQYSARDLSSWAEKFKGWARDGKEIYCYLDNDQAGYAAQDALKLQEFVTI